MSSEIAFATSSYVSIAGRCAIYTACLTRRSPGISPGNSPQRSTSHPCCWSTPVITRMLRGHQEHSSHHRPLARSTSQIITNGCSQAHDRQLCRPVSFKRCYSNGNASAGSRFEEAATSGPPYVRLFCLSNVIVRSRHGPRLPPMSARHRPSKADYRAWQGTAI